MPTDFCKKHLPKQDTRIMLEDENGEDHHTTYLGSRQGLSGGWRGFTIKHDIKVGDVLVFQLVESTKFKASSFSMFCQNVFFFNNLFISRGRSRNDTWTIKGVNEKKQKIKWSHLC